MITHEGPSRICTAGAASMRAWQVRRFATCAKLISEKNRPDLRLLSVFLNRGVIPYGEGGGQVHKPSVDLTGYQVVRAGNLVLNNQQAWRGSVGVSKHEGIISPAYLVFRLCSELTPAFSDYLFQSRPLVEQYVVASKGVGDIQRDIYLPWMKNVSVPIPPTEEQAAIVRFLDYADRRIRRYVRAKLKLIKLLEEQKQAIIHRAVTRGLDPHVQLKPSGIDWLGDIPENWNVIRAKYIFSEVDKRSTTGSEEHLSMSQKFGLVPSCMVQSTLKSESYVGGKLCESGDLVLNRLKAHLGVFSIAKQAGVISPDYSIFRMRQPLSASYYELLLRSSACRHELRVRAKGIVEGFWRLYTDDFYGMAVPRPPIDEQNAIVAELESSTRGVAASIAQATRQIELIGNYRSRIVADVVTGKLDVREAAARLPDEKDTPDEELFDTELVEDEADLGAELEEAV